MRGLVIGLPLVLLVIAAGFVAERIFGPGSDPMAEAREAVEAVPYRVSVREASEGVLVGAAHGQGGAVVHFAVTQEEPDEPADIPPRLIHVDKRVTRSDGFTLWDDLEASRPGEPTTAVWNERSRITTALEGSL